MKPVVFSDRRVNRAAEKHGVHRRTVRQSLNSPVLPPRKTYPARPRPAIDLFAPVIDGWLLADQDAPRNGGTPPGGFCSGWSLNTAQRSRRSRCRVTAPAVNSVTHRRIEGPRDTVRR